MKNTTQNGSLFVFPSALGWIALRTGPGAARRLSFGHPSAAAASTAIGGGLPVSRKAATWQRDLIELLQLYAEGSPIDFSEAPIAMDFVSDFRTSVLNACRKVAYGETVTYGELAARAGAPGAARAVGTCMARNPLPLLIPCHRVTRTGGVIGPFSAVGGTKTKRKLLAMEAANLPAPCLELAGLFE